MFSALWRRPASKNCILCALEPVLYFSVTIADPCYLFKCNHEEKSVMVTNCFYLSFFVGMFTFSGAIAFAWEIFYAEGFDLVSVSLCLTNITFCLRSSVTVFGPLLLKKDHGKQECQGLVEILKKFRSHTIGGDLLNKRLANTVRLRGVVGIGLLLTGMILYALFLLKVEANFFVIYKGIALMCSFYTDMVLVLSVSIKIKSYTLLLRQSHKLLQINLEKRWITFSHCRRIHSAFVRNWREWEELHDPLTVFWLLCASGIMVGNNYIIIMAVFSNSSHLLLHGNYISVQLQSNLTASILGLCIIYVDQLYRVVSG